jgi:hypothetical protein
MQRVLNFGQLSNTSSKLRLQMATRDQTDTSAGEQRYTSTGPVQEVTVMCAQLCQLSNKI